MNKKLILAPVGALAVLVMVASVAYACTTIRGKTEITQINGANKTLCKTDPAVPDPSCTADVTGATGGLPIRAKSYEGTADIVGKTFFMHFLNKLADQDAMKICMSGLRPSHSDKRISVGVVADSFGNIADTAGTIPGNIHAGQKPVQNHLPHNGVASVCFVTDGYGFGTQDATLLITGGSA